MTHRVPADDAAETHLTVEEQAEVMRIQEELIDLLGNRGEALAAGNTAHADALQQEIDGLMRERDDIKMWAAAK